MWPHSRKTAKSGPCRAVSVLLVGIVPNPYAERRRYWRRYSSHRGIPRQSNEEKATLIMCQSRGGQKSGSSVEKVALKGTENTGFFRGYRKGARCLYLFSRKWGNSFYIAPLSDTLADSPKSARQPTHLGPIQRPVFRTFKRRSHRG